MKKMILVMLSLFAITAVQAQKRVTLKQCDGDTVLFLKRAFDDRKAEFIGQPFSKVIEVWKSQLPVGRLVFSTTGIWPTKKEDQELVNYANLYFNSEEETDFRGANKIPYYGVGVRFAPPYRHKVQLFWEMQDEEGPLGPRLYEYLKDYIVSDIKSFKLQY